MQWWSGVTEGRSGEMLRALGWEEGVSSRCKAREAGAECPLPAYYSAREEGIGSAVC